MVPLHLHTTLRCEVTFEHIHIQYTYKFRVTSISYITGKSALPEIYAQLPEGMQCPKAGADISGSALRQPYVYIRQSTSACDITDMHSHS